MRHKKIEIVPYNPAWPQIFEVEAAQIKQVLGNNCIAIHHVGSTAVPGLCAKPKIDIVIEVTHWEGIKPQLEEIGYVYKGELNIPFRYGFGKRGAIPEFNLHVYEGENPEITLNLMFRNYLRVHKQARQEYEALKYRLIAQEDKHKRLVPYFSEYNRSKDGFIKNILNHAGFNEVCFRLCLHYDEWEAARDFRQKYFFDKVPVADPYTWTFEHEDHAHFVLYKGTRIVGYAHLQLWKDQRAALRIIVIDEGQRGQGLGEHFLRLCERWLKQQGFKSLHTQASPEAHPFYRKYGYTEMPFNDPDEYESDPQDVDLGKAL